MEGVIVNFRKGRHTRYTNQMIIESVGVTTAEKAQKLVGKQVVFKTTSGATINGTVRSTHGNHGAIRVLFERGMPGQSIGTKVTVQ